MKGERSFRDAIIMLHHINKSEESEDDDTVLGFNGPLSPAERAEAEDFGRDYAGPKMTESESARLMVLMAHASTCPGR